jgi:hypothetical protein
MAFPTKDVELIPYSENWDSRLAGDPLPFGLTAAQATQYHTLHNAFLAAYEELSISVAQTSISPSLASITLSLI